MRIKIQRHLIYPEEGSSPKETFSLSVEGETSDTPKEIADTYLKLRKKLRKGIGKESK